MGEKSGDMLLRECSAAGRALCSAGMRKAAAGEASCAANSTKVEEIICFFV